MRFLFGTLQSMEAPGVLALFGIGNKVALKLQFIRWKNDDPKSRSEDRIVDASMQNHSPIINLVKSRSSKPLRFGLVHKN